MKRALQLVLGVGLSVLAVWISMQGVSVKEVLAALAHSNRLCFLAVMALALGSFLVRAVRWRSFFPKGTALSTDSLYSATMIGFMANNVLPFRLGEFVRAWALARRERCSTNLVLATVVVERVVDMLTLIAILGVVVWVHPHQSGGRLVQSTRAGATTLVVVTIALTLFLIVVERTPGMPRRLVERLSRRLPARHRERIVAALDHFIDGLGLFRDLPRLLWVFLLSFIMFSCFGVAIQLSMIAFGIHLPWYAGFTLLVISAFAIMVPAAPGYVGIMNAACIAGLALFGVTDQKLASPFAWFYWAAQWLPVTVVGLLYLRREGLSLWSLGRAREEVT
jgi:glycosyltransferase 2 family protein